MPDHISAEPPQEAVPEAVPEVQPQMPNHIESKMPRARKVVAVPVATREPVDPTLRTKASAQAQGFLEPVVPDVEEMLADSLLKGGAQKKGKRKKLTNEPLLDPPNQRDDLVDAEYSDEEVDTLRRRAHVRMQQKKVKKPEEVRLSLVGQYLAMKQLAVGDFLRMHRRACAIRKAGVCTDGGFVKFKQRLTGDEANRVACEVCMKWMHDNKVTYEDVKEFLNEKMADLPSGPSEPVELPEQAAESGAENQRRKSKAEIRAQCVEYINSVAHLEAMDGQSLKYHCKICVSKKQKSGKINTLGLHCTL